MRHLIIVLESTLGGTRKYCADLLQRIDLASYRVTYIYATARADRQFYADLPWMRERGITLVEIPMVREVRLLDDLRSFVALVRYFRKHPYDIVHAHSSKAGFLARLASKLARPSAKTVYQPHMMAFQISRWYLHLERFATLFTDLVIADSESERRAILEHGIVRA
ncbi:MAG: glycosyltransferase, partial [Parvularculaceae bacterium]|nr:glycosyltransferase [Parvularculaceae bacterium]